MDTKAVLYRTEEGLGWRCDGALVRRAEASRVCGGLDLAELSAIRLDLVAGGPTLGLPGVAFFRVPTAILPGHAPERREDEQ